MSFPRPVCRNSGTIGACWAGKTSRERSSKNSRVNGTLFVRFGPTQRCERAAEIQALYTQVNRSIQLHSYGPRSFLKKSPGSNTAWGLLQRVLEACGTDSLVFVNGLRPSLIRQPEDLCEHRTCDSSDHPLVRRERLKRRARTQRSLQHRHAC